LAETGEKLPDSVLDWDQEMPNVAGHDILLPSLGGVQLLDPRGGGVFQHGADDAVVDQARNIITQRRRSKPDPHDSAKDESQPEALVIIELENDLSRRRAKPDRFRRDGTKRQIGKQIDDRHDGWSDQLPERA
jgi:hypothetical protein